MESFQIEYSVNVISLDNETFAECGVVKVKSENKEFAFRDFYTGSDFTIY